MTDKDVVSAFHRSGEGPGRLGVGKAKGYW